MNNAKFVVRHPVVMAMVLIVLVAFGFYSLSGQNVEFISSVDLPSVIVYTIYPGASAEDVEKDVTKILEDDFVTLPNYKSMDSISQDSVSWITVSYQDDVDPYDQLEEMRYRISRLRDELPDNLSGDPVAIVGGSSMLPSMMFTIEGGNDVGRLTEYFNDTLKPMVNRISGVAEVSLSGGRSLEAQVRLRSDDLVSKGISVLQVYQMLQASNTSLPLDDSTYQGKVISTRYDGSYGDINDLKGLTIGTDEDHNLIRLSDVADVSLGYPEQSSLVNSDGQPLLVVSITNRSDGNIVKINSAVKTILEEETARSGDALSFGIINDYSKTTLSSIKTVIQSGILGVIMAVIIIALFLADFRMTLIISLSIPLSILFSFIGMKVAGISLNLMSLSGLVTALGMVVDASIVMLEEVYRYYGKRTMPLDDCIVKGSGEVTASILASNLTTIVVFIPVAMLSGLVGMILRDVALTLIFALVGSFLVAVLFVPFLMKVLLKKQCPLRKDTIVDRGVQAMERGYRRGLRWAMDNRKFVILASILVLFVTIFTAGKLGVAFIPSVDNGDFYVDMEYPRGYTLADTQKKTREAEAIVRAKVPEIDSLVAYQGRSSGFVSLSSLPNLANFYINLVPVSQRDRSVRDIMLDVQEALSGQIPDCTVKVANGGFDKLLGYASGGGGYGLTLISEDMDTLYREANRLLDHLRGDPAVVTASIDTSFDTHTLVIGMAQDYMASLGVSSLEAGLTSRILFSGVDSGRFTGEDGKRYVIRLESDMKDREMDENVLSSMQVKSLGGTMVDFSNLADFKVSRSISAINHTDRAKTITLSASLVSEDALPVTTRMQRYLEEHPLADGVDSKSGGMNELIGDSVPAILQALVIAFFLVYTVMVLQFERFRQPFIVLASIPFCVIGVIVGLLAFGSTVSLISMLGVISLGGIVVNNAIILIDYVNQYRSANPALEGEDAHEHLKRMIAEGSSTRIRPILMTTLTTMLGVVPMAIAHGEGAELYAPLGQAIAGGLFTSTLITLFLVPAIYYGTEDRILRKKEKEK